MAVYKITTNVYYPYLRSMALEIIYHYCYCYTSLTLLLPRLTVAHVNMSFKNFLSFAHTITLNSNNVWVHLK